jgi:hypothetical protein
MLWRKEQLILPCAGITLIRFSGIISDYPAESGTNTPGTLNVPCRFGQPGT